MSDLSDNDIESLISDKIFNGWKTSGFTHLTDLGLTEAEFHLIPEEMDMTPIPINRSFERKEDKDGNPEPAFDMAVVRDMFILNAPWVASYNVPDRLKAFCLTSIAFAAENGLYDVVSKKEFKKVKKVPLKSDYKALVALAGTIEVARATMLWWSKTYNVWNTRHTLPELTDAMLRYLSVAAQVDLDLLTAAKTQAAKLLYRVMHPWDERIMMMFHPAGIKQAYNKAFAAASGRGLIGTKRDRYLDLRAYTLPEGTHRVALALVFYSDLLTSGAVAVMPTDALTTLEKAVTHSEMIAKEPMAFHSSANHWGVSANQLDMTMYDELFPYMYSYYTVTRTRPSMLQNPRVRSAGKSAKHEDMVAVYEASKPKVELVAKPLIIAPDTLKGDAARVSHALALLRQ